MLVEGTSQRLFKGLAVCLLLGIVSATTVPRVFRNDAIRPDPCGIALAPHSGDSPVDREIVLRQGRAADGVGREAQLERLGWAFIRKARLANDPGFFSLGHQAAACILRDRPQSLDAKLLAAHALHSLHHFSEGTALARELVAARNRWFDHALLGDLLMEQGDLDDAVAAYQHAMDLRPGPQMYSRAAHVRWLKGDLSGAFTMMRAAAKGVSGRDREGAAWIYSRLAIYELQRERYEAALQWADAALALQPESAPALYARGRIYLARSETTAAVESLTRAVALNRLPDYLWALAEALQANHRGDEARRVEDELIATGAANDPRTFALFLATRGKHTDVAVRLARTELKARRDVFTYDALAWALLAAGDWQQAYINMQHAVAEQTDDGRISLHAAVIATAAGRYVEAAEWRQRAARRAHMLLPSERDRLKKLQAVTNESASNQLTVPKEGT